MPTLPMRTAAASPSSNPAEWPERYGDRLYRFALARIGDAEAAADLVQETFLAALQAQDRFAGASAEFTWLAGILKHKALDHRRRIARRKELPEAGLFDDEGYWRDAPTAWPADALEREELREALRECLAALPPQLAEAFVLREVEGRRGPELCQLLGIAATNVWTRLHRARMQLRDCLERNWFRDPPALRSVPK